MAHAFHDIEKAAIVTVQSILNARECASVDHIIRLRRAIGNLPPHRALLVYGYSMSSIAARMAEHNCFKDPLSQMGKTITDHLGNDFAIMIDSDIRFHEKQRDLLAENLYKIAQLMEAIASHDSRSADFDETGNLHLLLEALSELSWRSADQALGKPVEYMKQVPANDIIRHPVSPKQNDFFLYKANQETSHKNKTGYNNEEHSLIET